MSENVICGIKNLLHARGSTINHLHIGWFGGEPMMAYSVVKDIMDYVNHGMPHPDNFYLTSDMTANGWLLSASKFSDLMAMDVESF